eukprot:1192685-Prorocentrum_minimum.AAC.2
MSARKRGARCASSIHVTCGGGRPFGAASERVPSVGDATSEHTPTCVGVSCCCCCEGGAAPGPSGSPLLLAS